MTDNLSYVFVNLNNQDHLVGKLWFHQNNGKQSTSFKYDELWLKSDYCYPLDPFLQLVETTYHTESPKILFGPFSDCAPDTWGRTLARRNEMLKAKQEKRARRMLSEFDYLMAVNDFARQGALRFKTEIDGDFVNANEKEAIPPLVQLPKLLKASENLLEDKNTASSLKLLLEPGSSLGGARPKASVIDNHGNLCIAKFPKKNDSNNNVLWEFVALTLAKEAGLNVQEFSLEKVHDKAVLILKRFDREGNKRIPFCSGMTMLNASDGQSGEFSYLNLADIIRTYSTNVIEDLKELWSRILFSVLISNTDDHLRNHGFLWEREGWNLSPLYDVNPSDDNTEFLQLNIEDTTNSAEVEVVFEVADYFGLSKTSAQEILNLQRKVISKWQSVAKSIGLSSSEISYMKPAFSKVK